MSALRVKVRKLTKKTYTRFNRLLYTAASPYLPIIILGERVIALLDLGSEVNVISLKIYNRLGLLIREIVTLNIYNAFSNTKRFIGIIKDVPISIGLDISY